ncbi:MAG: cytochrome c5 family protein [Burkholderiales bacterium]|nr:cytochrome c5 family protein [Burkholderiales bacterium]
MSFHTATSSLILLTGLALAACDKTPPAASPSPAQVASAAPAAGDLPPIVPVPVPPVPPEHQAGKKVFDKTCGLCHGAGTGGAPRPGDKANWAPRIAQGRETLHQHALLGFNGAAGFMPARGGAALSDDEVKAGVDYMVFLSQ